MKATGDEMVRLCSVKQKWDMIIRKLNAEIDAMEDRKILYEQKKAEVVRCLRECELEI